VGYSLDRHKYPQDPRGLTFVKQNGEHGLTSPQVVYPNGRRFLFVGGMFASNFINIFRYEDEMAVPCGLILQWGNDLYRTEQKWPPNKPKGTSIWRDLNGDGDYQAEEFAPNIDRVKPGPFWVDKKGNIWMAYGFFRYDFQGLDEKGNPIYRADKITVLEPPDDVKKVARVCYLDDTDTLVVANEGHDMRHIGRVFICKGYLAGNRKTVSFQPSAGKEAGCVAAPGDYAFTGGWKERGRIGINRLRACFENRSGRGLRARRGDWRGATREHIREKSVTEEQRSQPPRPAARPPEIFSKHALMGFAQGILTFWTIVLLPFCAALIAAQLAALEHQGDNWKHILALPVPRTFIFAAKWMAAAGLLSLSSVVLVAAYCLAAAILQAVKTSWSAASWPVVTIVQRVFLGLCASGTWD
jgi:hypothetical protein